MSWAGAIAVMGLIGVILVASGVLMMVLARRTADGRLGPNHWAGMRTRTTKSSPEAWLAAHQAAEQPTMWGGWASVATGVLPVPLALMFSSSDPEQAMAVWAAGLMIGTALILTFVLYGAWLAQQAARKVVVAKRAAGGDS